MPIQNLAREEVVTATTDTSAHELARTMHDENVGSVVITNDASPVGIVTDRDLATRVIAENADPGETFAEEIMSSDLCTIEPDEGFYRAGELMRDHGVRRLPVCDDNDELVGIITADDVTELLADEQQLLADVIRSQRPPY